MELENRIANLDQYRPVMALISDPMRDRGGCALYPKTRRLLDLPPRPLPNIAAGPKISGYMRANYDALGMPFGQFDQFLVDSLDQRRSMAETLRKGM